MVPAFISRTTKTFTVLKFNCLSITVLQVPYLESMAAMVNFTFHEKKLNPKEFLCIVTLAQ